MRARCKRVTTTCYTEKLYARCVLRLYTYDQYIMHQKTAYYYTKILVRNRKIQFLEHLSSDEFCEWLKTSFRQSKVVGPWGNLNSWKRSIMFWMCKEGAVVYYASPLLRQDLTGLTLFSALTFKYAPLYSLKKSASQSLPTSFLCNRRIRLLFTLRSTRVVGWGLSLVFRIRQV